ncbi:MAG: type II toxin-antitoxin system RelE/ParE family toxin [Gammaproteobacteria bacterium]|nr:type II toxin-antitoxin system RelE/ParE family toxin [Gammaproteobacteria bacterium]
MKTVRFLSPAEREMAQAAQYYNSKVPNLGTEFLREVKHAVKRLEADPEAVQAVRGDVRRWLIRRFPFGILYRVDPGEIVILAVMHLARQPDYWHGR